MPLFVPITHALLAGLGDRISSQALANRNDGAPKRRFQRRTAGSRFHLLHVGLLRSANPGNYARHDRPLPPAAPRAPKNGTTQHSLISTSPVPRAAKTWPAEGEGTERCGRGEPSLGLFPHPSPPRTASRRQHQPPLAPSIFFLSFSYTPPHSRFACNPAPERPKFSFSLLPLFTWRVRIRRNLPLSAGGGRHGS